MVCVDSPEGLRRLSTSRSGAGWPVPFPPSTPRVSELNVRSDKTLDDLARMFNKVVQGWINYYGRFYKSRLCPLLRRINDYLVRWAKRKYKRLRGHTRRAKRWLARVARREPKLFAHWKIVRPDGWTMGAG